MTLCVIQEVLPGTKFGKQFPAVVVSYTQGNYEFDMASFQPSICMGERVSLLGQSQVLAVPKKAPLSFLYFKLVALAPVRENWVLFSCE